MMPTYFNFSTYKDNVKPTISSTYCDETAPSTLDNICFDVLASDNQSGIESAIILIRDMTSGTYTYELSRNALYENATELEILLN